VVKLEVGSQMERVTLEWCLGDVGVSRQSIVYGLGSEEASLVLP
jgi:hypothetical protein